MRREPAESNHREKNGRTLAPETPEEKFLHYEARGGKLPLSTYQKVIALVESKKPPRLGAPTEAQAEHEAEIGGILDTLEERRLLYEVTTIYGTMRENVGNVLELPHPKPEDFRERDHPTKWSDQELFAEALLIADLIKEHRKYTFKLKNIFN